jgi:hypothetical protein
MHIHLPKPFHGWREFLGEVGVIVLGVLIALGAEQAIEGLHDRRVAAQSRRDVREEVGTDIEFYRERLQESSCIASRLSQLSTIVERGSVPKDIVKWVARPNDFAPFAERWHAVTSSARTAMFPADEQGSFDEIYEIFARMDEESQLEQQAWTNLDIMEQLNGPIDAETRLVLLKAIEQARRSNKMFGLAGSYVLFQAQKLGIASNPETLPTAADIHSICLPLSTPAAQAEKLLQPRHPN